MGDPRVLIRPAILLVLMSGLAITWYRMDAYSLVLELGFECVMIGLMAGVVVDLMRCGGRG